MYVETDIFQCEFFKFLKCLNWGGGGTRSGFMQYGGVQLRGPKPYAILGKAGLQKHTLF